MFSILLTYQSPNSYICYYNENLNITLNATKITKNARKLPEIFNNNAKKIELFQEKFVNIRLKYKKFLVKIILKVYVNSI